MTDSESRLLLDDRPSGDGRSTVPVKVFINYRHEDTEEAAARLYDLLAARFGAKNVFFDSRTLGVGTEWLAQIKAHGANSGVFLALIGRTWVAHLHERRQIHPGDPQDFVQVELEFALGGRWPGKVIPILVNRATMPRAERLPKAIRALAGIQAMPLGPLSFEEDFEKLTATIEAVVQGDPAALSLPAQGNPVPLPSEPLASSTVPAPSGAHYATVLQSMLNGSFVPVLGNDVRGSLPDADDLAAYLAEEFKLELAVPDLAEVTQRLVLAKGPADLDQAIEQMLTPEPEPNATHRFLARYPRRLRELGLQVKYQMIVTTNYDCALEEAFKDEREAYDLAIFLGGGTDEDGPDKGKFLHVPWEDEPHVIDQPSEYRGFKIDGRDVLDRTLIVKINGAVRGEEGGYRWDRSYVLTENQYIDYLVGDGMERLVPCQLLKVLKGSHCLFLGYPLRDWSGRVFLKRTWKGHLKNPSWAIQHQPDAVESDAWGSFGRVELLAMSPDDYVSELDARLDGMAASPSNPT